MKESWSNIIQLKSAFCTFQSLYVPKLSLSVIAEGKFSVFIIKPTLKFRQSFLHSGHSSILIVIHCIQCTTTHMYYIYVMSKPFGSIPVQNLLLVSSWFGSFSLVMNLSLLFCTTHPFNLPKYAFLKQNNYVK